MVAETKISKFFLVFQLFIGSSLKNHCKMDAIAQTHNSEKLSVMMRSQMPTQETITSSEQEVIVFLAANEKIMGQVVQMNGYLRATQDLETSLKKTRDEFIEEAIDYYIEHNDQDSFLSSGYKEFIVK